MLPATRPWPPAASGLARFRLFNASSGGSANRPRIVCGASGTLVLRGKTKPLSGAVAADGAVTQTLSGERPAGLRTTRAEPVQARTGQAGSSRPSMKAVKELLNVVDGCEIRGRLRVHCGKYRIFAADSEGRHPQPPPHGGHRIGCQAIKSARRSRRARSFRAPD